MTVSVARHHQAKAQALGASSKRSQESPALQLWTRGVRAERNEVVKGPGVFDAGNAIRFEPDAEYAVICGVLLCGFDAKAKFHCITFLSFLKYCHVLDIACFIVSYDNRTKKWHYDKI